MASSNKPLPVVILISGTGSNMCRMAEMMQAGQLPIDIKAVISDRADAKGLITAKRMGIPTDSLNPKSFSQRSEFDAALAKKILSHQPELVILAGFMRILSPEFVEQFSDRMLNIHPSLLPKYPGLHTHQRTLEAGDQEHGASVHFVTAELDGGPVVIQAKIPVLANDTADTLAKRLLQQEHQIYPLAVMLFASGRLQSREGTVWLDGRPLTAPLQYTNHLPESH
jgi:phosphoribosylglycinamide formyltransferase-1